MQTYHLTLPVDNAAVDKLAVGDTVYLTGVVATARDMAHLKLRSLREEGAPLPLPLEGSAIFHAGPVVARDGENWTLRVIGPTTSIRMEPHADLVADLGVKLIIGKGGMAAGSLAAFARHKQAYLQAVPGCATVLAQGVRKVRDVFWLENGMPEAMWVLEVEDFGPFVVTMDAHGQSRYADVTANAQRVAEEHSNHWQR